MQNHNVWDAKDLVIFQVATSLKLQLTSQLSVIWYQLTGYDKLLRYTVYMIFTSTDGQNINTFVKCI